MTKGWPSKKEIKITVLLLFVYFNFLDGKKFAIDNQFYLLCILPVPVCMQCILKNKSSDIWMNWRKSTLECSKALCDDVYKNVFVLLKIICVKTWSDAKHDLTSVTP